MKTGVRFKLFAISVTLVVGVGLISGLYLERLLRIWLGGRIENELQVQVRVARDLMELSEDVRSTRAVDEIAERLARSTGSRVTIVRRDGVVLGDSNLSLSELSQIENHAQRPEVVLAVLEGQGVTTRYSTTVHADMLYVGVPFKRPEFEGVIRMATPLSEIDAVIGRLRVVLTLAGLVGLGLAVGISGVTSHLASRPLRNLVRSARLVRASEAPAGHRLPVSSNDELGHLAGSFNELVGELDHTLQNLTAERGRLETILEGMTEALLALDPEDRVTHVNRAAVDLLGLSETAVGHALIELVRVPALAELMERVHRQRGSTVESELSLSASKQVLARAAQVKSTGGTILVMLDITEMRRLEKVRRDFVANVSHELRTPVSVIQANAETLLDGALTHPTRGPEFMQAILRNAQRLSRLVSDLLDLSRIESGHFTLQIQPTAVANAVQRAVESIRGLAARKQLAVELRIDPDIRVLADGSALDQILTNLIVNAVKYTPEKGHVEIRAHKSQSQNPDRVVHIDVADDGAGIEAHHKARIFERFYRVDPGRSRDVGGTGLGLSIVKHLVGAMRGEVGVTDNPSGGSVFRVTLPGA